jgi:coenzyme F420-reducing hydrogenase alpha subunit
MPKFSLDRRQFTLGAAAAATAALLHPGEALAQTAGGSIAELDKKTRDAMAKLSPAARAEVETKVANIFRKYGERLNEEQKADIRRIMAESQEGLEKMRAFALENGDQPADAFRAYHSESASKSSAAQSSSTKSSSIKPREQNK